MKQEHRSKTCGAESSHKPYQRESGVANLRGSREREKRGERALAGKRKNWERYFLINKKMGVVEGAPRGEWITTEAAEEGVSIRTSGREGGSGYDLFLRSHWSACYSGFRILFEALNRLQSDPSL